MQEIFEHLEDIEDIKNKLLTAENELAAESDECEYLENRVERLEQELSIEYCNNCTLKNYCTNEWEKSLSFERCFERIERE